MELALFGGMVQMATKTIIAGYAKSGTSSYNSNLITIGSTASGSRACLSFDISSVINAQISSVKLYLTQSSNIGQEQSVRFDFGSSNVWNTTSADHENVTSKLVSGTQRLRVWTFTSSMITALRSHVSSGVVYLHLRDNGGAQVVYEGITASTDTAKPRLEIEYTESASTFTLNKYTVDSGSNFTMTIVPASSAFSHSVYYTIGSTSSQPVAIAAGTTTATLNIPHSALPSSTSATATITLNTINGSTTIGSNSTTVTVNVPASIVPSATSLATAVVNSGSISSWPEYVQGYSKCKLTLSGVAAGSGSSLSSVTFSGGGYSTTVTNPSATVTTTTNEITTSGSVVFTATIRDARGRTATVNASAISVYAYGQPVMSNYSAQRSDSSGNASGTGTYITALASWTFSSVNGKNSCSCTVKYKDMSTGTLSAASNLTSGTKKVVGGGNISTNKAYQLIFYLKDTVSSTVEFTVDIPSAFNYAIFVSKGGGGISFGKYGATDGLAYFVFDVQTEGDVEIGGELKFTNAAKIPYWNLEKTGTQITAGSDFNSILTAGNYYCASDNGAASLLHKPASLKTGFGMKVFKSCGIDTWLIQEIVEAYHGTTWRRCVVVHNDGTYNYDYGWTKYMEYGGDPSADDPADIPYWNLTAQGIEITSGQDFNSLLDYGNYYCELNVTAQTLLHRPTNLSRAFLLRIYSSRGESTERTQEVIDYFTGEFWRRRLFVNGSGVLTDTGSWYHFAGTAVGTTS